MIELGRLAKKPEVKTEAEKVEQAEAPAVAAEEAMFTEDVFEDEDVELSPKLRKRLKPSPRTRPNKAL